MRRPSRKPKCVGSTRASTRPSKWRRRQTVPPRKPSPSRALRSLAVSLPRLVSSYSASHCLQSGPTQPPHRGALLYHHRHHWFTLCSFRRCCCPCRHHRGRVHPRTRRYENQGLRENQRSHLLRRGWLILRSRCRRHCHRRRRPSSRLSSSPSFRPHHRCQIQRLSHLHRRTPRRRRPRRHRPRRHRPPSSFCPDTIAMLVAARIRSTATRRQCPPSTRAWSCAPTVPAVRA